MRVALYELLAGDAPERMQDLRALAAGAGWTVVTELVDRAGCAIGPRPALVDLRTRIQRRDVDAVVAPTLADLLRSTAEAGSILLGWLKQDLVLATLDGTDTRRLADHVRLREGALFVHGVAREIRARAARAGLAGAVRSRRHPRALVPQEQLAELFHRGLSLREIEVEMRGVLRSASRSTLSRYIAALLEAGTLSASRRAEALQARGGARKGGRPLRRVSVDVEQLGGLVAAGKSEAEILRALRVHRGKLTRAVLRRLVRSLEETST